MAISSCKKILVQGPGGFGEFAQNAKPAASKASGAQAQARIRLHGKGQVQLCLRWLGEWVLEKAGRGNVVFRALAPLQQVRLALGRSVATVLTTNGRVHRRLGPQGLNIKAKRGKRCAIFFSVSENILK